MFGLSGRQIFILLFLAAAIFAIAQYFPAYYSAFQFNDFIRQEVRFAAGARKTPEVIRGEIVKRAEEMGIGINPRDIKITRRGPAFTLELQYRWPIDLRIHQHELVFDVSESGEVFEPIRR